MFSQKSHMRLHKGSAFIECRSIVKKSPRRLFVDKGVYLRRLTQQFALLEKPMYFHHLGMMKDRPHAKDYAAPSLARIRHIVY